MVQACRGCVAPDRAALSVQESQDFADDLARAVEARIDKESVSLFDKISDIKDDPASG